MKKPDFYTAARRFAKSERCISWLILAAGVILGAVLFSYAVSIPMSSRIRGDAYVYMMIANRFSSLRDAFTYVGDRTYGFPLFLYLVKAAASPATLGEWVAMASYCQFLLHVCACLFFYAAFLKEKFHKTGLPVIAAPAITAALLAYPALVTYTTTPLTDTFCADLLMLAAAAWSASRKKKARPAIVFIFCGACGLLLGYAVMVRPVLIISVAAFYVASFYDLMMNKKWRAEAARTVVMTVAALCLILPAMWNVWEAQGGIGLQDKGFVQKSVHGSMQIGLSAVRVYWSNKNPSQNPLPGIRDPYLDEVYGKKCTVDSASSLVLCLLSQPQALPLYFAKKTIGLFDAPHLQPYAVDLTSDWFVPLERVFGTAAFCGFISLIIMTGAHLFSGLRPAWIELPWAVLVLIFILCHTLMHIEGRYGFPVVPFCLPSFFLGFAGARQAGRRFYLWWLLTIFIAAGCFIYQIYSWDSIVPV